eukprot:3225502-Pleurochrysis_carterae.AAC.1
MESRKCSIAVSQHPARRHTQSRLSTYSKRIRACCICAVCLVIISAVGATQCASRNGCHKDALAVRVSR